uniref:Uncharacterized protein n=1 Tax=Setaria viridis TaxID=4556 RepID=A0A4U6UYB2_SETVI|nr:hypothetical protein SEVIR_4G009502v2 [Setaria viridis]
MSMRQSSQPNSDRKKDRHNRKGVAKHFRFKNAWSSTGARWRLWRGKQLTAEAETGITGDLMGRAWRGDLLLKRRANYKMVAWWRTASDGSKTEFCFALLAWWRT